MNLVFKGLQLQLKDIQDIQTTPVYDKDGNYIYDEVYIRATVKREEKDW